VNEPNADEWKDTATRLRAENERLRAELRIAGELHAEQFDKITGVAAFLDRLAAQMERWTRPPGAGDAAADCRAKARELRGD